MLSRDAYRAGQIKAAQSLHVPPAVNQRLLRTLEGPYGSLMTRIPANMLTGSMVGAASGMAYDDEDIKKDMLMGSILGVPSALSAAAAPELRQSIINRLRTAGNPGMKLGAMRGIPVRYRKSPFYEIARRIAKAFRLRVPKINVEAQLKRLFRNPFRLRRGGMLGKLKI